MKTRYFVPVACLIGLAAQALLSQDTPGGDSFFQMMSNMSNQGQGGGSLGSSSLAVRNPRDQYGNILDALPADVKVTPVPVGSVRNPFAMTVALPELAVEPQPEDDAADRIEKLWDEYRNLIRSDFEQNPIRGMVQSGEGSVVFLRDGRTFELDEKFAVSGTIGNDGSSQDASIGVRIVDVENRSVRVAYSLPQKTDEEFIEVPLPSGLWKRPFNPNTPVEWSAPADQ